MLGIHISSEREHKCGHTAPPGMSLNELCHAYLSKQPGLLTEISVWCCLDQKKHQELYTGGSAKPGSHRLTQESLIILVVFINNYFKKCCYSICQILLLQDFMQLALEERGRLWSSLINHWCDLRSS